MHNRLEDRMLNRINRMDKLRMDKVRMDKHKIDKNRIDWQTEKYYY